MEIGAKIFFIANGWLWDFVGWWLFGRLFFGGESDYDGDDNEKQNKSDSKWYDPVRGFLLLFLLSEPYFAGIGISRLDH